MSGGAPRDELDRCCREATAAAGRLTKPGGPCQVPPMRRDYGGVATVQGVQDESLGTCAGIFDCSQHSSGAGAG